MEKQNTKVFVSNISPSASEKTVTDFFSFCGKINALTLRTLEGGLKEAVIDFQTDAAAKTALLLTNALIVDRPIAVSAYTPEHDTPKVEEGEKAKVVTHENSVGHEQIEHRPQAVPDEERTQTSVIASLLAAGYKLGTDTIDKAREYDEQHHITETLKAQTEALKAKAQQLDSDYQISATAAAWKAAASSWWSGVDQTYGISQKAAAVKDSSYEVANKIGESEVVHVAAETLATAKDAVIGAAETIKTETGRLIDQQPTLKAASTRLVEGADVVGGSIKGVGDQTSKLIAEQEAERKSRRGDSSPSMEEAALVIADQEKPHDGGVNPL